MVDVRTEQANLALLLENTHDTHDHGISLPRNNVIHCERVNKKQWKCI
jgi:hypothetical protein